MTNVKTAISLPKSLFERAESVAEEMKITRSHLMALALEEFISRRQNQQLLDKINAACAEPPDEEEQAQRRSILKLHRQIVEGEW
jgi:metal-responsive CopG/Arc/MetJ family transcriptional regulator